MENILISSCLIGNKCRYDGKVKDYPLTEKLRKKYKLISICPECDGGLSVPRFPAEISGERVINSMGEDVTDYYERGAEIALLSAKKYNCRKAVLKEKSPSCGKSCIYDGTFSKTLKEGMGITAKYLMKNGIEVFSENDIEKLL